MNYVIKGLLKRVFQQYLNLKQSLDLQSGVIKLASGTINHQRINKKIQDHGYYISQSLYKGITISIPVTELMSKPIKIKIQLFELTIIQGYTSQFKSKQQVNKAQDQTTVKSIVNRLLYNMQISVQRLSVKFIMKGNVFQLNLHELHSKNSLVLLDTNIIKKTINLNMLTLQGLNHYISLKDFNICADYNNKQLKVIALLGSIEVQLPEIPFEFIINTLKSKSKKPQQANPQSFKITLDLYLKLNEVKVCLPQISLVLKDAEIKSIVAPKQQQLILNFKSICILYDSKCLISLQYLPYSSDFQIFYHLEDNMLRSSLISLDTNQQGTLIKVYYLKISVDYKVMNQFKKLLIFHKKKIEQMSNLMLSKKTNNEIQSDHKGNLSQFLITVYRVRINIEGDNFPLSLLISLTAENKNNFLQLNILNFSITYLFHILIMIRILKIRMDLSKYELVIVANKIKSQLSKKLLTKMSQDWLSIKKQLQSYKQLISEFQRPEEVSQSQNQKPKNIRKIYMKIPIIVLKVGEINLQKTFVSLFQLQVSNSTLYYGDKKIKAKVQISLTLYSPHTLQKNILAQQVRVQLVQNFSQWNISLKNNLNITVEESHIKILTNYISKDLSLITFYNLTNKTVKLQQNNLKSIAKGGQKIDCFLEGSKCTFIIEQERSKQIQITINQNSQKEIQFMYKYDLKYILRCNELGLTLKNKYMVAIFTGCNSKTCQITLNNENGINNDKNMLINVCNCMKKLDYQITSNLHYYKNGELFEDLSEGDKSFTVKIDQNTYKIESLMSNQKYKMYGLRNKLYDYYILQTHFLLSTYFQIMPFLIITNDLDQIIILNLRNRKSQESEQYTLNPKQSRSILSNNQFDFYMKQLTFTIRIASEIGYSSQQHYFNTFFMVDEQFQTVIELRTEQKNQYGKAHVLVSQQIIYKTKKLIFTNPCHIINKSSFPLKLQHKQRNGCLTDYIIDQKKEIKICFQIKDGDSFFVFFNNFNQNKVQILGSKLKDNLVLSFNFYQQGEKYYHALLNLKFQTNKGIQSLLFQDFLQLTNLCKCRIQINDRIIDSLQTSYLLLPSTVDHRFNNKVIQVNPNQMDLFYSEIFMSDQNKISAQQPLIIRFLDQYLEIPFNEMLLEGAKQSNGFGVDRKIYTLIKDLKTKIHFYICQNIHSNNTHYSLVRNMSSQYFLLAEDGEYIHHFQGGQGQSSEQKVLIKPKSFNKLIGRQHYEMLMCDEDKRYIHKIDKMSLQKQRIKIQLHTLDSLTIIDIDNDQQSSFQMQFISKSISLKVKVGEKALVVSLEALTLRILQKNKVDCLIRDISLFEDGSKQPIIRVPQQSYFLIEGKQFDEKFFLIKNLFVKCKHAILNIHQKLPGAFLSLYRLIGSTQNTTKQTSDAKLRRYLSEQILLIRNIYFHEIHLSLTIKMQSVDFSNAITLPNFQLNEKGLKAKGLQNQISKFYLTNLLAAFPKLSFFLQNLKNPINIVRTLFNLRTSLKDQTTSQKFIIFQDTKQPIKNFSLPFYNILNQNKAIAYIEAQKKHYLLTTNHLIIINPQINQQSRYELCDIEKIKIVKNRNQSELLINFKKGTQINLYAPLKKCQILLTTIQSILL